jgi:hypothetical protein
MVGANSNTGGSNVGGDGATVVVALPDEPDEPEDDEPLPPEEGKPEEGKPPELRGTVKTGGRLGAVPTGRVGCGGVVDATGVDEVGGVVVLAVVGVVTVALRATVRPVAGSPATG